MTTATKQSRFGRGGEAAVEAEEEIAASRGGGASFRKTHYLPKIGKGKHIVLRYLLDSSEWWYVMSHPSAPTKGKPSDWPDGRSFPENMPAVCRYDKAFKADPEKGLEAVYHDCYICDAKLVNGWGRECKPVIRVYTLAVVREEVVATQEMVDDPAMPQITAEHLGKSIGYRDATREVEVPKRDDKGEVIKDKDGKTVMETIVEPQIIVVNQAVNNYFNGLQSMFGIYKTVTDRDYVVKQNNEGKDVEYVHIPLEKIESLVPGAPAWERYPKAIEAQGDSVDIEHILMDRSSDDYYATFFDPSKEAPKRGGNKDDKGGSAPTSQGNSAPAAQQNAAPSNEPDPDALAAMRARMRGGSAPAATEAAAEPEKVGAAAGPIDLG